MLSLFDPFDELFLEFVQSDIVFRRPSGERYYHAILRDSTDNEETMLETMPAGKYEMHFEGYRRQAKLGYFYCKSLRFRLTKKKEAVHTLFRSCVYTFFGWHQSLLQLSPQHVSFLERGAAILEGEERGSLVAAFDWYVKERLVRQSC